MKYIGPHVGIGGGLANAPRTARELGATGFAMFTKNQRQWRARALTPDEIAEFRETCRECGFPSESVLPHDSYLINLAQPDDGKRAGAREAFADELKRAGELGLVYLNFHPGSGLGAAPRSLSIRRIGECVRAALEETEGVRAVFENTAGQGDVIGCSVDELRDLLEAVGLPERCGVCIDTCHAYAAGIDLSDAETCDAFWREFEEKIGMEMLCGMHINDSKGALGSHLDRHHSIGQGFLGKTVFEKIAADPRFDGIPLILETPAPELWPEEIRMLREAAG